MIFHHYGLAVKEFNNAVIFYENIGYSTTKIIYDKQQKVNLIYCTKYKNPSIELIKPTSKDSPVTNFLKMSNEMIYHTCYEITKKTDINRLFSKTRTICVSEPKPAILFNNLLVSFYYVQGVGVIEILHNYEE